MIFRKANEEPPKKADCAAKGLSCPASQGNFCQTNMKPKPSKFKLLPPDGYRILRGKTMTRIDDIVYWPSDKSWHPILMMNRAADSYIGPVARKK